jgi:hypothetical protein
LFYWMGEVAIDSSRQRMYAMSTSWKLAGACALDDAGTAPMYQDRERKANACIPSPCVGR